MESCFKDLRSKTFQWGKKGLLSKKRTKKGPVIELLRTFSRYFHNNAKRSYKARVYDITHFATKVRMFIVVGLLYIIHMTPFPSQEKKRFFCVKKRTKKGPFQQFGP